MARRPGITFETAVPALPEALPRMDVAAFVGFATRGPIGIPVPVEDVSRFRDVFGPPLELVRDPDTGRMQTAHLVRAVEAFFQNGGRRCWVVRVAGPAASSPAADPVRRAVFGLPGLVSLATGRPTEARARCFGASFDRLRVGTVLHRRVLPQPSTLRPFDAGNGSSPPDRSRLTWATVRPGLLADGDIVRGDVLRFRTGGRRVGFAAVTTVATQTMEPGDTEAITTDTGPVAWFDTDPAPLVEPLAVGVDRIDGGAEVEVRVVVQTSSGSEPVADRVMLQRREALDGMPVLTLQVDAPETALALEEQLVHIEGLGGDLVGWMQVGSAGSGGEGRVPVVVREALWPVEERATEETWAAIDAVERLRMDLLVWKDQELLARLNDLGLSREHPRGWPRLPTDDTLFALQDFQSVAPDRGTLWADAFEPRFPLAGPGAVDNATFLPLGMADRPDSEQTAGRHALSGSPTRLERERLATFAPEVFVDPELAQESTSTLARTADQKIFIDARPASGLHSLWPIREVTLLAVPDAIHRGWAGDRSVVPQSASTPFLPIPQIEVTEEAAVIRLSWAGNRLDTEHWTVRPGPAPAPGVDETVVSAGVPRSAADPAAAPDDARSLFMQYPTVRSADQLRLSWTIGRVGREGVEVEVQEATEPTFDAPVVRYRGGESSVDRYVRSADPRTLFFRYRVTGSGQPGAWSNTRRVTVPAPDFTACADRPDTPGVALYVEAGSSGQRWLRWRPASPPSASDLRYDIHLDRTSSFDAPTVIDVAADALPYRPTPPGTGADDDRRPRYHWVDVPTGPETPAVRYARVRARRPEPSEGARPELVSGWSETVAIARTLRQETPLISTAEYDTPQPTTPGRGREGLLDVQAAMLRFAAARADVLAVLALPEHDRPEAARGHATRLRTPGAVLGGDEEIALSYGALYYPWLLRSGSAGVVELSPPDGAACGVMARQALQRGAWTAPANVPLEAARSVLPPLDPAVRAELGEHRINAFGRTAGRVLTLDAATLAHHLDWTPISTRRLLILVRRLAEREGPSLVFNTNSRRLRQGLAEQFDALLRRLFRRNAFAGATPAEAYRVVADDRVNPPEQIERGRLVVELQVAPAQPLRFLTVRLVQRGREVSALAEPVPAVS